MDSDTSCSPQWGIPEETCLQESNEMLERLMLEDFGDIAIDIDMMLYRPWLDGEKKYGLGFDPKTITALAWSKAKQNGGRAGLSFLIRLGVDLGDDLNTIARTLKADRASEFQRLIAAYGLVSRQQARGSETALTLSRLCCCFPTITCEYVLNRPAFPRRRGRNVVSPEKMAAISPYYPVAMMTYSFAFLIPNRDDAYCVLLMKAHMLHEYEAQGLSVNSRFTSGPDDHKDKIKAHVVKRTLDAITASCVEYDQQIGFLKRIGLVRAIVVGERSQSDDTAAEEAASAERAVEGPTATEEIVVAEPVAAAARVWDSKDLKYDFVERFTKFYR